MGRVTPAESGGVEIAILPCPFCGGLAKLVPPQVPPLNHFFRAEVYCTSCFARSNSYASAEAAIESWNNRAGSTARAADRPTNRKEPK